MEYFKYFLFMNFWYEHSLWNGIKAVAHIHGAVRRGTTWYDFYYMLCRRIFLTLNIWAFFPSGFQYIDKIFVNYSERSYNI